VKTIYVGANFTEYTRKTKGECKGGGGGWHYSRSERSGDRETRNEPKKSGDIFCRRGEKQKRKKDSKNPLRKKKGGGKTKDRFQRKLSTSGREEKGGISIKDPNLTGTENKRVKGKKGGSNFRKREKDSQRATSMGGKR